MTPSPRGAHEGLLPRDQRSQTRQVVARNDQNDRDPQPDPPCSASPRQAHEGGSLAAPPGECKSELSGCAVCGKSVSVKRITSWNGRCGPGPRAAAAAFLVGTGALVLAATTGAQSGGAVLYGDTFLLSGEVEGGGAGRAVVVLARPHGRARYSEVGHVRTTAGGGWRYNARPAIRTLYRARVGRLMSTPVAVDVEPRIVLRASGSRFTARVHAARRLAGKFVVLQSRTSGLWKRVRRLELDDGAATSFTYPLPAKRTQIRLFMPRSQVGPGYVAARSAVITLPR
jgi:hypothetical protein